MSKPLWSLRGNDRAVADHIAARIAGGARQFAFPGGKTPYTILADLAARPLPWSEIHILPTDERVVAPDHPASNVRAIREALRHTDANIHPLTEGRTPPRLDLVWVGMGLDGHVASLFPSMNLDPGDPPSVIRAMPDPLPSEAPFERLSMNYAALRHCNELIVVARGPAKRVLIEEAVAGANTLPIGSLLLEAPCPVSIFWSES